MNGTKVDIKVVNDLGDCSASDWNDLLESSQNPFPFQRYEWIRSWWENLASGSENLFILLARKQDKLIGIAPLSYKRHGWPGHAAVRFIGSGHFDYFDFIIARGEEEKTIAAFIAYIRGYFKQFELQLKNIFKDSPSFGILSGGVGSKDLNGMIFREDVVPYLKLPDTKEQFYNQTDRLLRSDVKRRQKRLTEQGKAEFKRCNTFDEARDALEDFFAMHIKRWESAEGYSVYKFPSRRKLMRDLLQGWFEKKLLNIYYLSYNEDKKLAICIAFEFNRRFIFYTHAYDPDFAKFSPAKILVSELINFSIDNRYKEFDFGIGREAYKLEWPCEIRGLCNIYIYTGKNTPLTLLLKWRRCAVSVYLLSILPFLRKFRPIVYLWRRLNQRRGKYQRFE
jgi:CelD/BcsL family acetyltransferase involved in cellulose biosynthesis